MHTTELELTSTRNPEQQRLPGHHSPKGQPLSSWWQKGVPHSMQRALCRCPGTRGQQHRAKKSERDQSGSTWVIVGHS